MNLKCRESHKCWYVAWTSRPKKNPSAFFGSSFSIHFWRDCVWEEVMCRSAEVVSSEECAASLRALSFATEWWTWQIFVWKLVLSIYPAECFVFHQHIGIQTLYQCLSTSGCESSWLVPINLTPEGVNELILLSIIST